MASGTIYILVNPALKGLLKIGKTTRTAEGRAAELSNNTSVPTKFLVAYEDWVQDCDAAEKLIHTRLAKHRYERDREFFQLNLKEALPVVMSVVEEVNVHSPKEAAVEHRLSDNELTPPLPISITPNNGWFTSALALYEKGDIAVTDKALSVGYKEYKLKNIVSVQVVTEERRRRPPGKPYLVPIKLYILMLKTRRGNVKALISGREFVMEVFNALTTIENKP
jgi:hypothetical protein